LLFTCKAVVYIIFSLYVKTQRGNLAPLVLYMPKRGGRLIRYIPILFTRTKGSPVSIVLKDVWTQQPEILYKVLFLLSSLVDNSSRDVSFSNCETKNSVTNNMNQIYRNNFVNSAMKTAYITCRIQGVSPGFLQTHQTDFHHIKFYRVFHSKADNFQTLCAMDHVHL